MGKKRTYKKPKNKAAVLKKQETATALIVGVILMFITGFTFYLLLKDYISTLY